MSLYNLAPKPGFERYTIQVGWNPHRSYFATVVDLTWDPVTDPHHEPDTVRLGRGEIILDRPRCCWPSNPTPTYRPI